MEVPGQVYVVGRHVPQDSLRALNHVHEGQKEVRSDGAFPLFCDFLRGPSHPVTLKC
jgi:hypothetical protein